jgi:hypothetical protein
MKDAYRLGVSIIVKSQKKGVSSLLQEESHFAQHVSMIEIGVTPLNLENILCQNGFIENTKHKT